MKHSKQGDLIIQNHPPRILACNFCVHQLTAQTCYAFPNGIPQEILSGENKHQTPLTEQSNEIIFEQIVYQSKDAV